MPRNKDADGYIKHLKSLNVPYNVNIKGIDFPIEDTDVYPPGKLTEMFIDYIIKEKIIEGKVVADLGCGCYALGIIAAMNGAQMAIGADINSKAIDCAKQVIAREGITNAVVIHGEIASLLPSYSGAVDVILSGPPWDSVTSDTVVGLESDVLERAFYDVDESLLRGVMCEGRELYKDKSVGKTYITSSQRVLERVEKLCAENEMQFKIVKEEEIELGNPHYILCLSKKEEEKKVEEIIDDHQNVELDLLLSSQENVGGNDSSFCCCAIM